MITKAPFVGFTGFYVIGILIGEFLYQHFMQLPAFWGPAIFFALLAFLLYRFAVRRWVGVSIAFLFMSIGFGSLFSVRTNFGKEMLLLQAANYDAFEATITTLPEKRAKSMRMEAVVTAVCARRQWKPVHGKVLLSIPIDAPDLPFPGDRMVVLGKLEPPPGPQNPDEFDYKIYLGNKGIGLTAFLKKNTYHILPPAGDFDPGVWTARASEWADRTLKAWVPDERAYGLIKAMLLGRRDDLRTDQIDDYAVSGTVHILSVSGMHVALIFSVITFAFGWVRQLPAGKWLYLLVVVSLLLFYAVVTGFPPTVQRATFMCILLVVSQAFNRDHHNINTLGASAFFILLTDPRALFDIGFQLSYLAMLGIFLFYGPLKRIWSPENRIAVYIRDVSAVAFAAQLMTFPVSIYFFHQFPTYFWLINPVVILLTDVLLPAAMLLLLLSFLPFAFPLKIMGWIVSTSGVLTNYFAGLPKHFPVALLNNLDFDGPEVAMFLLLLLIVWWVIDRRSFRSLQIGVALVITFSAYSTFRSTVLYGKSQGVIHSVRGGAVLSFKNADQGTLVGDINIMPETFRFHLRDYFVKTGVLDTMMLSSNAGGGNDAVFMHQSGHSKVMQWKDKVIVKTAFPAQGSEEADYVLLSSLKYPRKTQDAVISTNTTYVLDRNFGPKTRDAWKAFLVSKGATIHDLERDGALLLR